MASSRSSDSAITMSLKFANFTRNSSDGSTDRRQGHIQIPVKHLIWSYLRKYLKLLTIFAKAPLRCMSGF